MEGFLSLWLYKGIKTNDEMIMPAKKYKSDTSKLVESKALVKLEL